MGLSLVLGQQEGEYNRELGGKTICSRLYDQIMEGC